MPAALNLTPPMTNTEKRLSDIEAILRTLTEKKRSTFQKIWTWIKPYLVPFVLGMILGGLSTYSFVSQQQAASGGAAIPFPSGKPSPSLSALPPSDSNEETADSSSMSTFALPSQVNPAADNGQTRSTKLFRTLTRRTR